MGLDLIWRFGRADVLISIAQVVLDDLDVVHRLEPHLSSNSLVDRFITLATIIKPLHSYIHEHDTYIPVFLFLQSVTRAKSSDNYFPLKIVERKR